MIAFILFDRSIATVMSLVGFVGVSAAAYGAAGGAAAAAAAMGATLAPRYWIAVCSDAGGIAYDLLFPKPGTPVIDPRLLSIIFIMGTGHEDAVYLRMICRMAWAMGADRCTPRSLFPACRSRVIRDAGAAVQVPP